MHDDDLISRSALLEFAHNHINGMIDCNDIARFPAVAAAPGWISVDERLPKDGQRVQMDNDKIFVDGVPACYGCIESVILRSGDCLHCAHVEGCKRFYASLKKNFEELFHPK